MIRTIRTKDLKVGMHVIIPASWINHPFAMGQFDINSKDQIQKIIDSGFAEVKIDDSKGFSVVEHEKYNRDDDQKDISRKWEPDKLVPAELREAIRDKKLSPEKKATVVYKASVRLMARLLDDPKAENIGEAKKGIADIVDMVFSQDDTANYLLRITAHDYYTYTHSVNVGILGLLLSKELLRESDAHNMHEVGAGFFLHDLGKVRVDPGIINKPSKLTEEEMKQMKTHPYQSYKILKESDQLSEECAIIALQHHEREDGTGYPRGRKSDQIHIYGRMCSIVDVYDSLTSDRSYKARLSSIDAVKIMSTQMLHHFHKDIFEKFVLLFTKTRI
jgi:HD-GYP domain-containing protein (c-di-GMP phosphodiesterase class II)